MKLDDSNISAEHFGQIYHWKSTTEKCDLAKETSYRLDKVPSLIFPVPTFLA